MKYTDKQKQRAIIKLARTFGHWNHITKNDAETQQRRQCKMTNAVWKVIEKFNVKNDYFLATGDYRGKKPKGARS